MTSITPASPIPDADVELRRAVALAYRAIRRQGGRELLAWQAARQTAMELRPDMSEEEAGRRATLVIAWAATEHPGWFWKGVGADNADET